MVASPVVLEGRVFQRLHRFTQLRPELQTQTAELQEFILASDVFQPRYVSWSSRSLVCVRGDALMRKIFQKLSNRRFAPTQESADRFFDALVLSGFVTPLRESETQRETKLEGFADDKALFVRTESTRVQTSPSVWDVRDGAEWAGAVQLAARTYAAQAKKRVGWSTTLFYAVVNLQTRSLYVFASDYARQCLRIVKLKGANVELDCLGNTSFRFGLHIASAGQTTTLLVSSERQQTAWRDALVAASATCSKDDDALETVTCGACVPMLFS